MVEEPCRHRRRFRELSHSSRLMFIVTMRSTDLFFRLSRSYPTWCITVRTKHLFYSFSLVSDPSSTSSLFTHTRARALLVKSGLQLHEQTTLRSVIMFTVRAMAYTLDCKPIVRYSRTTLNTPNRILAQPSSCSRMVWKSCRFS